MFGHYPRRAGYQTIAGYNTIAGADGGAAMAQQFNNMRLRGAGVGYPVGGDGGPQVYSNNQGRLRQFPLGFLWSAVGKSSSVSVTEKPQVTFRGERLVMPDTVDAAANPFKLQQILVGQASQFVSSQRITALVFSPNAVGIALALDTATVGQDITLTILNSDAANTHDFEAALIGTCQLPT